MVHRNTVLTDVPAPILRAEFFTTLVNHVHAEVAELLREVVRVDQVLAGCGGEFVGYDSYVSIVPRSGHSKKLLGDVELAGDELLESDTGDFHFSTPGGRELPTVSSGVGKLISHTDTKQGLHSHRS